MANKVIIGIVGKHYISDKKRTDSYIRDEVKQAIFDNDAIAIGILSPNEEYVHYINIEYPSKFYNIVKENRIKVNSRHKNILEKYPLLQVSATDEDGYPDVVESENKKFYIGVRFHPESLYKIDTNMNNIFRYFIDQCKKNK